MQILTWAQNFTGRKRTDSRPFPEFLDESWPTYNWFGEKYILENTV